VFAVILAALALMGAPANTQVLCIPNLEYLTGDAGLTEMWQDPKVIELGRTACAGILLAAMTPKERKRTELMNPDQGVTALEGDGLLVLLHEAHHASGDFNETDTECAAMKALPGFLKHYGYHGSQLIEAQDFDKSLSVVYHAHPCHG
jgi:hypothetical protein